MAVRGNEQREYRARKTYGDLAYDLDYAEREYRLRHAGEEGQEEKEPYMRPAAKPAERPVSRPSAAPRRRARLSVPLLLGCVVFTGLLLMTVLSYVRLAEVSGSISALSSQLSDLQEENAKLTTKHELTFDLATVKARAEAAGMSKPSSSQTYYMDLSGDDTATVFQQEDGGKLGDLVGSLRQCVCTVLEYFQ